MVESCSTPRGSIFMEEDGGGESSKGILESFRYDQSQSLGQQQDVFAALTRSSFIQIWIPEIEHD